MRSRLLNAVFSAILFASNIFLVGIYGEIEFTLAILKVCLIVGMNIMVSASFYLS